MRKLEKRAKARLIVACAGLTVMLSALSARIVYLQVVAHEKYAVAAMDHYRYREELPASRGSILDRHGDTLARNQTVYSLVADCRHLRDLNYIAAGVAAKEGLRDREARERYDADELQSRYFQHVTATLAGLLKTPPGELRRTLEAKDGGEIILARDLEEDLAQRFRDLMEERRVRGIYLRRGERRSYPSPLNLTHVIGYVQEVESADESGRYSRELVGREGVERAFDEVMRGEAGHRYIERDSRRREIHAFRGDEKLPVPGHNVRLTIDMGLQVKLEEILEQAWEEYRPEKITSVWMDPRSGEVLAMASRPHFDLATRQGERRNAAVSDMYEPGSTFKIVAAAGAFNEGLVTPSTEIYCHGGLYAEDGLELKDHSFYSYLSAEDVLVKSSNIGIYKMARQLNRAPFHEYMERFGFGQPTGIELTSEASGVVHPVRAWNQSSFSRMAMGYAVGVTPLQMATAYCAVANGGELLRPRIVRSIEDGGGRVLHRHPREVARRVISEQAAAQLSEALRKATGERGTGTNAALPGYEVAGKTGTAQKNVPGRGYAPGRYVVSFAGFLPAKDPELVGLMVVDDPKGEGISLYGGTIAAPLWQRVALQAVRLRGIPPQDAEIHRLAEINPGQIILEGIND